MLLYSIFHHIEEIALRLTVDFELSACSCQWITFRIVHECLIANMPIRVTLASFNTVDTVSEELLEGRATLLRLPFHPIRINVLLRNGK